MCVSIWNFVITVYCTLPRGAARPNNRRVHYNLGIMLFDGLL